MAATAGEKKAGGAGGDKPKFDAEAAFKKLDKDGDGKISLDEFKANPRFKGDASKAEESFKAKDKDGDGKLSLDEFKTHSGGKKKH
jgi:Ca2+-binding EF-hand superfamily protein